MELVEKTRGVENFVVEFMNRCFALIENSRRENLGVMEVTMKSI